MPGLIFTRVGGAAPGVLPELDALGELLEANEEWRQDAAGVRSRMLTVLGAVADRYEARGRAFAASALTA